MEVSRQNRVLRIHENFIFFAKYLFWCSDGKETVCKAGDPCLIPRLGISPGGENGNPLQYSCLENPMDRVAWWAAVYRLHRVRQD